MARIYLAGAESIELLRTLVENGSKDIMLSFFYLQQRGAFPRVVRLLKDHPDVRVFMDSGSRTFLKEDRGDPQPYWRAYYELLKEHGHRFEYASEFDIDGYAWKSKGGGGRKKITDSQIEAWREDLHELETVSIVPVWHPDRGEKSFDAAVQDPRYPHVAIGDADISRGEGGRLIGKAHAHGKTVHGYGQLATPDNLKLLKFDTVSSSTWLVGQRFGDICIFQGGNFRRIYASSKEGKKTRARFRKYFESIGCNPDAIENDDRQEINKANIIAWINLSKRLQLAHPHKGPRRPTIAPEATNAPIDGGQATQTREIAVQRRTEVLPPAGNEPAQRMNSLQPMESVTVEKTEETAISLQEVKPFMPLNAAALMCDACALSLQCPKFQTGAVCGYREEFARVAVRDANEVVDVLASMFAVNVERARYMRLAEQLTGGGMVDPSVTKHMTETFQMGAKLAELMKGKKGVKSTVQGQGVLSKFFGEIGGGEEPKVVVSDNEPLHTIPEDEDDEEFSEDDDPRTERQRRQANRS